MELTKQNKKSKGKDDEVYPLLMVQEYWMNTYYSVARHTGGVRINGKDYIVVDKFGRSLFETSIPVGATADLIYVGLQKPYKKLCRDAIIEALNRGKTLSEIKAEINAMKSRRKITVIPQKSLFD